jgi:hypothetical protein
MAGRPPKIREQIVPAYPEPYARQSIRVAAEARRKRGRPKKVGRPKKNVYDNKIRASPSKRAGKRWISVSMPEEAYYMLKEVAAFYKVGMGNYMYSIILPAFDHAYQESLTLQRIAANKEKAKQKAQDEIPDRDDVPRRTHF